MKIETILKHLRSALKTLFFLLFIFFSIIYVNCNKTAYKFSRLFTIIFHFNRYVNQNQFNYLPVIFLCEMTQSCSNYPIKLKKLYILMIIAGLKNKKVVFYCKANIVGIYSQKNRERILRAISRCSVVLRA